MTNSVSSSLPSSGLRQLMGLDLPRVSRNKCGLSSISVQNNKSLQVTTTTESESPCDICTHVPINRILSIPSHNRRHLDFIILALLPTTDDDGEVSLVLCSTCGVTVRRLLALTEEVEEIQVRIKATLTLRNKILEKNGGPGNLEEEEKLENANVNHYFPPDALILNTPEPTERIEIEVSEDEDEDQLKEVAVGLPDIGSTPTSTSKSQKKLSFKRKGGPEEPGLSTLDLSSCIHKEGATITYQCPKCPKMVEKKTAFFLHLKCFHNISAAQYFPLLRVTDHLQCHVCGQVSTSSEGLRQHLKGEHGKEKTLVSWSDIQPCDQTDKFKCLKCPQKYDKKYELSRHMKRSHNIISRQTCPICHQGFRSELTFQAHCHPDKDDLSKVIYNCRDCNKVTETFGAWKCHLQVYHSQSRNTHQCEHCGRVFARQDFLKRHITSCSVPLEEQRTCGVLSCGASFPSVAEKVNHERVEHKKLPRIQCYFCHKVVASTTTLASHLASHTLERPFICEVCGKDFVDSWGLKRHMIVACGTDEGLKEATRVKEREYERGRKANLGKSLGCPKCGKAFTHSTTLKNHLATVCGSDEKVRDEVRRKKREAMRAFRANLPYPCDLCEKRFRRKELLVDHKKWVHLQGKEKADAVISNVVLLV